VKTSGKTTVERVPHISLVWIKTYRIFKTRKTTKLFLFVKYPTFLLSLLWVDLWQSSSSIVLMTVKRMADMSCDDYELWSLCHHLYFIVHWKQRRLIQKTIGKYRHGSIETLYTNYNTQVPWNCTDVVRDVVLTKEVWERNQEN